MMTNAKWTAFVAQLVLLSAGVIFVGCDTEPADLPQYSKQPIVTVTPAQQVRQWLQGVAESGQLDSGAEVIKDMIEQMRESGTTNVDELLTDADELIKMKGTSQIKAKANEILGKIPE